MSLGHNEIKSILQLIDVSVSRGAWQGNEIGQVASLRDKVVQAIEESASEETEIETEIETKQ